ncbi:MAG: paraquat-inducible protein A [Cycloclasticus sp.]|nr:paraquat-inducible protein A [Cycloclasticus sp.]
MVKYRSIALFLLSIVFLVPGLTLPLMSIEATVEKQGMLELTVDALTPPDESQQFFQPFLQSLVSQLQVEGSVTVFKSTRSLWSTMSELVSNGHVLVGLLIGMFGVLIPVFKILLVSFSLFTKQARLKQTSLKLSSTLSKWSMSDVFVMGLIVAFLAINANEYAVNTVRMTATLGSGFYFFVAYCLSAIAAAQLMALDDNGAS